jgi:hypothetical protein
MALVSTDYIRLVCDLKDGRKVASNEKLASTYPGCFSLPGGWVCEIGVVVPFVKNATSYRLYYGPTGAQNHYVEVPVGSIGTSGTTINLEFLSATEEVAGAIPVFVDYLRYKVFDNTTPIDEIAGASVEIYGPNTSPNSGGGPAPEIRIGTAIGQPVRSVKQITAVNGQDLKAPNAGTFIGNTNVRFVYPDVIQNNAGVDFTTKFGDGDSVTVTSGNAVDPGGVHGPYDLSGTYKILSVTADTLVLANPAAVVPNWANINVYTGSASTYGSPTLSTLGPRWVGPFQLNINDLSEVWCNFVAINGLYKEDSKSQYAISVDVLVGITAVDSAGNSIGAERYFTSSLRGSSVDKGQRGITMTLTLPVAGPCAVRVQRITNSDLAFNGSVVDGVKWRECYAISPVTETDFGDVTTILAQTYGTEGALSVKDRKLNLMVTRKIKELIKPLGDAAQLSADLRPVKDAGSILCHVALDPYIGNRQLSELDLENIYSTIRSVATYFGSENCTEFCYTFDNSQVSFEEAALDIATAIFSTAYRRGRLIKLFFEKATANSTILFNHRNKVPKSETRTVRFGLPNEFDGVEYEYTEPNNPSYQNVDMREVLHFPEDNSAKNPKKVSAIGIRNFIQAKLQGWRIFQKLLFQNTTTKFQSTKEAALTINTERVLVADNTRPETQDGEIVGVELGGFVLQLSQKFNMDLLTTYPGITFTIFLQLYDGTVEALDFVPSYDGNPYKGLLLSAPSLPLVFEDEKFAKTTYVIVGSEPDTRSDAFIMAEKSPASGQLYDVTAINYDERYYAHDNDVIGDIIFEPVNTPANYPDGYPAGDPGDYTGPAGDTPDGPKYPAGDPGDSKVLDMTD